MNKIMNSSNSIWITWERQTRNRSASRYIEIPLFEIIYDRNNPIIRYIKSSAKTINLIIRRKPSFLFVQNPSIVLALIGVLCSKLFRFRLIVDAHNSGILFEGRFKKFVNLLNRLVIRNSNIIIVTNNDIAKTVSAIGGKPVILPDPLPALPSSDSKGFRQAKTDNRIIAFCITSWGEDEPIEELIRAASAFKDSVNFYLTGNYHKANFNISTEALSENVNLLGFVDENVYFSLLMDCDFTVDLTTRANCLVCGAYESVSASKPIILSDTKPQREYFNKGAVFCGTTPTEIQAGIEEIIKNLDEYKAAIQLLKAEVLEREQLRREEFISSITE